MKRMTILLVMAVLLCGCVQERHSKAITFMVDMNAIENPTNVGVRGQFLENGWDKTTIMSDKNNDGIYEINVTIETAQNYMEFKFVNNNDQFELNDQGNRKITFEYKPETLVYKASFNDPKFELLK